MSILHRTLAAALAAAATVPAAAAAAPDRTGAVSADQPSFAWDTKLGTGFTTLSDLHNRIPCGTPLVHDCDFTLLRITGPGSVMITNESSDPNAVDTDLYVYESDANGTKGPQIGQSAQSSPTPNESFGVDTGDGDTWILVETDYTDNLAGTVHGKATFTPYDPGAAPAAF